MSHCAARKESEAAAEQSQQRVTIASTPTVGCGGFSLRAVLRLGAACERATAVPYRVQPTANLNDGIDESVEEARCV